MSYRVLHIIDCFLPETMNWLEALLEQSKKSCQHHIFAPYYIRNKNESFQYVEAGIHCNYPISLRSKIKSYLAFEKNKRYLEKYILEHKIQIVHFHFGHTVLPFKKWIADMSIPFCVSLYGFDYEYLVYKNPQVKIDYHHLGSKGAHFIVEGNYSKKLLESYGIATAQIHKVHMIFDRGIKVKLIPYRQPIRLLQVASYSEKKNQLGLINALNTSHAGKFRISFFGEILDHRYMRELKNLMKVKSEHTIKLHGKLNWTDYLKELQDSHFIVNLSRRSSEMDTEGGCPVFLKDGLSLGKPAIASRHCDIPEWIINDLNGFLVEENNVKQVSDILDKILLLSENEFKKLCTNAFYSVEANSKQHITSSELISVYKDIL